MGDDIRSHTRKIGSCLIDVLFMDTDRQIPFLIDAVVGAADLGQQHFVVFLSVFIQPVLFHWQKQGCFKLFFIDPPII